MCVHAQVSKVWNFVGSTSGVLVLYVYPAAFYLRLRYVLHKKKEVAFGLSLHSQYDSWDVLKEAVAWVIFGVGLVLLVVENYQAIDAVVNTGSPPSNGTNSTTIEFCHIYCQQSPNISLSSVY